MTTMSCCCDSECCSDDKSAGDSNSWTSYASRAVRSDHFSSSCGSLAELLIGCDFGCVGDEEIFFC